MRVPLLEESVTCVSASVRCSVLRFAVFAGVRRYARVRGRERAARTTPLPSLFCGSRCWNPCVSASVKRTCPSVPRISVSGVLSTQRAYALVKKKVLRPSVRNTWKLPRANAWRAVVLRFLSANEVLRFFHHGEIALPQEGTAEKRPGHAHTRALTSRHPRAMLVASAARWSPHDARAARSGGRRKRCC